MVFLIKIAKIANIICNLNIKLVFSYRDFKVLATSKCTELAPVFIHRYSLMLKCWAHNTSDRPTFTDITECLEEYISSSSDSSHATDDRNYFVLEMTNITHEEPNESYDHLH